MATFYHLKLTTSLNVKYRHVWADHLCEKLLRLSKQQPSWHCEMPMSSKDIDINDLSPPITNLNSFCVFVLQNPSTSHFQIFTELQDLQASTQICLHRSHNHMNTETCRHFPSICLRYRTSCPSRRRGTTPSNGGPTRCR